MKAVSPFCMLFFICSIASNIGVSVINWYNIGQNFLSHARQLQHACMATFAYQGDCCHSHIACM